MINNFGENVPTTLAGEARTKAGKAYLIRRSKIDSIKNMNFYFRIKALFNFEIE